MGVFVVGMHRSGTSLVAAALHALGLELGDPEQLLAPDAGNPAGYYELKEIADFNDEALAHLGGRWDCPPLLHDGWENDPSMTPYVRGAVAAKNKRLPKQGWVLKDPRLTLLLPLWRRAVVDRCAAVLVVRNPMEVAWSVTLRNGLPTMTALALWSAYNRAALQGLGGLPVYVCGYDEIVGDPGRAIAALAAALTAWGELEAGADLDAAVAHVRPELRRNTWRRDSPDALDRPGEIDRLEKFLGELAGAHDVFEPAVPPAAPWEHALLSERRVAVEQVRAATADVARVAGERDEVARQLHGVRAQLVQLEDQLERTEGSLREAETRLETDRSRADTTAMSLAEANARWARLERRFPVRVLRAFQRVCEPNVATRLIVRWMVHGERAVYESEWLRLVLTDVEVPGGARFEHHVVRMPNQAAGTVIADPARGVLLLWRHRFITDTWGFEIPAGRIDPGESPEAAARREALEETGWEPGPLRPLVHYQPANGLSDQVFHLYITDHAAHVGEPLDPAESERVEWVPVPELRHHISGGRVLDGLSLTASCYALAFKELA